MILLNITITDGWLIFIAVVLFIILYSLYDVSKAKDASNFEVKSLKLLMQKNEAELKVSYQQWAIEEFERFKAQEITSLRQMAEREYREAASVLLQRWKIEEEAKIRQDAINRSYSVNLGKITEHLVPFHANFLAQFNPKDARFIGSPIDLLVFDGYADKKDKITVYFVEVKTGKSRLSKTQQLIKEAILDGDIRWAEINPDSGPMLNMKAID